MNLERQMNMKKIFLLKLKFKYYKFKIQNIFFTKYFKNCKFFIF